MILSAYTSGFKENIKSQTKYVLSKFKIEKEKRPCVNTHPELLIHNEKKKVLK